SNPAPSLAMDITLAADQSFTAGVESIGFVLAGALNLNGNNLAATTGLTISGPIIGAGSLTISGNSQLYLTGANTFSGPTVIQSGTVFFNGPQTSALNVQGGRATGAGT